MVGSLIFISCVNHPAQAIDSDRGFSGICRDNYSAGELRSSFFETEIRFQQADKERREALIEANSGLLKVLDYRKGKKLLKKKEKRELKRKKRAKLNEAAADIEKQKAVIKKKLDEMSDDSDGEGEIEL